jgi:hypothetical protein
MNPREILARLDYERQHLQPEGALLEHAGPVTRLCAADNSHHTVIFSSLTPDTADAAIDREIEYHRALGVPFEWKLYAHDTPPDLRSRLQSRGFDIGEQEAVLVHDLTHRPAWLDDAAQHLVRRIETLDDVDLFRRAAEKIFDKDYAFTAGELAAALHAGSSGHRGYLALDGNQVVSIGRLYTHPQSAFAGLYGGGTLPTHRGRGFYRAVVAARARDAIALGARYLVVDALPTSRPILQRLGFTHLTDTWPCQWQPPSDVR